MFTLCFFLLFTLFLIVHFFSKTGQRTKTKIGGSTTFTSKELRLNFSEIRSGILEGGPGGVGLFYTNYYPNAAELCCLFTS